MSKLFRTLVPATAGRNLTTRRNKGGELSDSISSLKKKYAAKREEKTSYLMGLVDATGSMSSVWEKTKDIISELMEKVSNLGNFHMNWVAYRDYCDGNDILEFSDWHQDAKSLQKFLEKIRCFGGGDFPEAVEKGLEFAVQEQKCTRVILIGDAPPHANRDYKERAIQLAKQGKKVFSFVVGNHHETIATFTEISQITGGSCHTLTNVDEILACVAMAAAEDIGGKKAVEKLLKNFALERKSLPNGAKKFADNLLNPPI